MALADDAIPLLIATLPATMNGDVPERVFQLRRLLAERVVHVLPAVGWRGVTPLVKTLSAKRAEVRLSAVRGLEEIAKVHGLPETAIDALDKSLELLRQDCTLGYQEKGEYYQEAAERLGVGGRMVRDYVKAHDRG